MPLADVQCILETHYSYTRGDDVRAERCLRAGREQAALFALYQDFRKFEKNSKAGAIQEIYFKMAGAAKKKSGFPRKNLGSNPGIGLEQPTNLTTKSQGIDCKHASLR